MKWTQEEEDFLRENYPQKGKQWCMEAMHKTEAQIRQKAYILGLKQDRNSDFFKEWQSRAANSKIGKKRPAHSEHMRHLYEEGKILQTRLSSEELSKIRKEWLQTHEHPRGMLGKKHTQETKNVISHTSKQMWANMTDEEISQHMRKQLATRYNNGTYAHERKNVTWKGGKRNVGGKDIYFRSRWEANYARYLEWLKTHNQIQNWEHEVDLFWFDGIKRGCVSYLPDFKVTDNHGNIEYHEVKGWMDAKSRTKLKRMAKYHPSVKVILIDGKQYKSIEKSISPLLSDWE